MKLAELLTPQRVLVPLPARDLAGALERLVLALEAAGAVAPGRGAEVARQVPFEGPDLLRAGSEAVIAAGRTDAVEELTAALGVAPAPLALGGEPDDHASTRVVLLLLTPQKLSTLKVQVIPTLLRRLRDGERSQKLISATAPEDVLAIKGLMEAELHQRLLVEDGLTPLKYRIYPDTPMDEVVDLMVRRGLQAVPVVGQKYEMLGLITSSDILKHLLPRRLTGDGEQDLPSTVTARDVMSRSVMCVSEDQSLLEAANLMVNKDVDQLPVVRAGELIGFLTRDTILKVLSGD